MNPTNTWTTRGALALHCLATLVLTSIFALTLGCGPDDTASDSGTPEDAAHEAALSLDAGHDAIATNPPDAAADATTDACGDTMSDPNNCGGCGDVCATGFACVHGGCLSSCPGVTTACAGACVNTALDPGNCGACGHGCAAGQVCSAGVCGATCGQQLVQCASDAGAPLCLNVQTDSVNCGACSHACLAGQVCSGAVCRATCQSSETECSPTGADPYCAITATDNANCGTCGHACAAGQVCSAGICGLTCQTGLVACNGTCVDPSTSRAFCGATGSCQGASAGTVCPGGQICNAAACTVTCPGGEVNCNGACVDATTTNQFCGATGDCQGANAGTVCAPGLVCSAGACGLSCQAGLVNCGGTCVDPGSSNQFCGASAACTAGTAGTVCAAGQVCSGGQCGLSCQAGLVDCNGTCVDPMNDRRFCGASGSCQGASAGSVCPSGQVCGGAGVCAVSCPAGQIECNGACVDATTNNQFCGAMTDCLGPNAGATCLAGSVCSGGACALSCQTGEAVSNSHCCPNGQFFCSNKCVDPVLDTQHCNIHSDCTGGVLCGPGQVCSNAACAATCAPPLVLNGASCVNPTAIGSCGATTTTPGADCAAIGEVCVTTAGLSGCGCPAGESTNNGGTHCCPNGQFYCGPPTKCDGFGPDGQELACSPPAARCIDPTVDNENCGIDANCDNGQQCGDGQVCSGSVCAATCAPPLILNDTATACVNPTSATTCGANGVPGSGQDCTLTGQTCSTSTNPPSCACPGDEILDNGKCCPFGQNNCQGTCVDEQTDPTHCSACDRSCIIHPNTSAVCSGGQCAFTCTSPFLDCNNDPNDGCEVNDTDPAHCGSCVHVCPTPPPNSAATCTAGTCGTTCNGFFIDCNSDPSDGCEVDGTTVANCGACGNDCSTSGMVCQFGPTGPECEPCGPGLTNCNSVCVDEQTDVNHCNGCNTVCTPPTGLQVNTDAACTSGTCGLTCQTPFGDCDMDLSNGCETNTVFDDNGCGQSCTVCTGGQSCSEGMCSF